MPSEKFDDMNKPESRMQVHWGRPSVEPAPLVVDREGAEIRNVTVAGRAVRPHVTVSTVHYEADESADGSPFDWVGTFVQLDRAGVNGLIRALRKARDQAFGRDE